MITHAICTALTVIYIHMNGGIRTYLICHTFTVLHYVPSVFDDSTNVSPVQGLELRILYAAHKGDITRLQELLGQGCPINAQDEVSHIGGVSFQL